MYQSKNPYKYGTGRRKSSVARVHLFENGTGSITINGRSIDEYFGLETLKMVVRQPLNATNTLGKVDIVATVEGGGVSGQAGALRHGISRALLLVNPEYRAILKKAGFLTRDPRMKERKEIRSEGRSSRTSVLQALSLYRLPAKRQKPQGFLAFLFVPVRNSMFRSVDFFGDILGDNYGQKGTNKGTTSRRRLMPSQSPPKPWRQYEKLLDKRRKSDFPYPASHKISHQASESQFSQSRRKDFRRPHLCSRSSRI